MHTLGAASLLLCVQIGFLYIRYVGSPRTLWDWVQPYVRDSEVRILTSQTMLLPTRCLSLLESLLRIPSADCARGAQEIAPSPEGKNVTMGAFVRDVFLEQVAPAL